MRDLWAWQEEMGIDESVGVPVGEDIPRYMPCEVVWDKKSFLLGRIRSSSLASRGEIPTFCLFRRSGRTCRRLRVRLT